MGGNLLCQYPPSSFFDLILTFQDPHHTPTMASEVVYLRMKVEHKIPNTEQKPPLRSMSKNFLFYITISDVPYVPYHVPLLLFNVGPLLRHYLGVVLLGYVETNPPFPHIFQM